MKRQQTNSNRWRASTRRFSLRNDSSKLREMFSQKQRVHVRSQSHRAHKFDFFYRSFNSTFHSFTAVVSTMKNNNIMPSNITYIVLLLSIFSLSKICSNAQHLRATYMLTNHHGLAFTKQRAMQRKLDIHTTNMINDDDDNFLVIEAEDDDDDTFLDEWDDDVDDDAVVPSSTSMIKPASSSTSQTSEQAVSNSSSSSETSTKSDKKSFEIPMVFWFVLVGLILAIMCCCCIAGDAKLTMMNSSGCAKCCPGDASSGSSNTGNKNGKHENV